MARSPAQTLTRYDEKRDFTVTGEPRGGRARGAGPSKERTFVVQKHDATRLHYDLRLEHGGVLWSWAVPKGPSLDPSVRRLAARTEDHPLEYASFEGMIPRGEYGGGAVIVWDRGTWAPDGDADTAMAKGHLRFSLHGEKLAGAFHLIRTTSDTRAKESWLLFKSKDDAARPGTEIVEEAPRSVLTGRAIDEVVETVAPTNKRATTKPTTTKRATKKDATKKDATRKPATKMAATKKDAPAPLSTVTTKDTLTGHPARAVADATATDDAATRASRVMDALSAMSLGFAITSPAKVVYPERAITKADVMGYLAWIAPRMLPLVAGRPLMVVRCPEGRAGQCFYQRHAGTGVPKPVRQVEIREKTDRGTTLVVEDVAGLVALGQIGVLEIHTWMCMADAPERPDLLTLDLDPDPSVPFDAVVETALALRDILARLEIPSFVKTTGGKGLHVVAPVAPVHTWDDHEAAAKGIVSHLSRAAPGRYVVVASKAARSGKIFLDWLRNGRGATAVAPYSLRAREGAPVALPIGWDALERGIDPSAFTLERLVAGGLSDTDPWSAWPSRAPGLDRRMVAMLDRAATPHPHPQSSRSAR